MEVRRAVRQLYVKPSTPGSNGKEWYHALDGGVRREPASQDSLPGPCGGQSLHLHPKQAQDDALEPHLPKACTDCILPESPTAVEWHASERGGWEHGDGERLGCSEQALQGCAGGFLDLLSRRKVSTVDMRCAGVGRLGGVCAAAGGE